MVGDEAAEHGAPVYLIAAACRSGRRMDLQDRKTMLFDQMSKVVSDPRGDERRMMVGAKYRQPGT